VGGARLSWREFANERRSDERAAKKSADLMQPKEREEATA
jgi:hypothetical protein